MKEQRANEEIQGVIRRRNESDELAMKTESRSKQERYGELEHPVGLPEGRQVTFRARIHIQREISLNLDFPILRHRGFTIQALLGKSSSQHMINGTQRLPDESIVQVSNILTKPPIPITLSVDTPLELSIEIIHVVEHSRLHNRTLDFRHPTNQDILKIRSNLLKIFREKLNDLDFIEINTPKLQPAATESGSEVFRVNYLGRKAFLAQSPQLMKQMAISADFRRCMRALAKMKETKLAPKYGYQLKWTLDFPSSLEGAIEATVIAALSAVTGEPVTFGAAVAEQFLVTNGIGNLRSKMMDRTYRGILKSLSLDKKVGFRGFFKVVGEKTYIRYPKVILE
uniref:Aminoacyl-tRNA synthetase class II (D/K/N) domain-containing protein n=1 Tax=Kwoniella pini CBS 10737 TaxID=1296096 RepID=A0A1B9I4W7_9TREE|nr:uncharacterized protein I206_03897 [Kwoniella pini CBS 10737]OCF50572.1 hypothetical protein I206_03897 [Kwoniella pini CBS 10737]